MYFDLPPASRSRRQPPSPSPRTHSPATSATTTTTTLLPFRRSTRPVNVAAALSPVQAYLQPQWTIHPSEPLWAPTAAAAEAPRVASPPPPLQQSPPQNVPYAATRTNMSGVWPGSAAAPAASTSALAQPYYFVNDPHTSLQDGVAAGHGFSRSPYRDDRLSAYRASPVPPSPAGVTATAPAAFAATPTVLMSEELRRPGGLLPPSPIASDSLNHERGEKTRRDRVVGGGSAELGRASHAPAGANSSRAATPRHGHGGGSSNTTNAMAGAASTSSPVKAAVKGSRPRGRGITEVRPGCTTSTERVRYRNNVTKKLIDLYDEVAELYECRENMNFQVTQAMRSDPRYTKERHGEVRLAYKPTPAQQAAMTAVDTALEALHDACHELVAAYLTPEEKRYLGIDTHQFQTAAEKKSTYQYAPASHSKKGGKSGVQGQVQESSVNASRASSASSSSSSSDSTSSDSSGRRHHHRHKHHKKGTNAQSTRQEPPQEEVKFISQTTSLPSDFAPQQPPSSQQQQQQQQPMRTPTPYQEERTATTIRAASPSPPSVTTGNNNNNDSADHRYHDPSIQFNTSAEQQYSAMMGNSPIATPPATTGRFNEAAPWNSNVGSGASKPLNSPSPPPPPPLASFNNNNYNNSGNATPQPQQSSAGEAAAAAEGEDTVAVGSVSSPERMYAPARSTSSLGGGAWPSDTASATVRASSTRAPPAGPRGGMPVKMPLPGGSVTVRGPQGQPLVKVPVQPRPSSPTLGAGVPSMPSSVSKWPPGIPPGAKLVKMPVGAPASAVQPPPPPQQLNALPSSHPPSHPPSRTNSVTNRTASTAPKAPATRAEFMRFLIDSDSDSTAA